ncbi:MAG: hypothetical protein SFV81_11350, partial [Pirellulaceae bacterium]|nr:hypothetical protein [Pirellulaceae bacterium]
ASGTLNWAASRTTGQVAVTCSTDVARMRPTFVHLAPVGHTGALKVGRTFSNSLDYRKTSFRANQKKDGFGATSLSVNTRAR